MTTSQTSMSKRLIAWLLTLCLVITLIPDIGYATEKSDSDSSVTQSEIADTTFADASEEEQEQMLDAATDPAMAELTEEQVIDKTENTTTYDMGDGTKSVVLHGGDVRFENDDGKLIDYDPSLIEVEENQTTESETSLEGYKYENKVGDKKQYLPEVLSEETPILMEYDGHQLSLIPKSETVTALELTESTATVEDAVVPDLYEGEGESLPVNAVYGSEDDPAIYTYQSGDAGIKETLTLNEKPETNVFIYEITVGNLFIKENVLDEGLTIIDPETDDIVAGIEAPWMNDATGEAYSTDITYDLEAKEGEEGTYILTMTVDEEYLSDEDRVYPVTIDPTVTWKGNDRIRDTYVIYGSGYAGTNFYETSNTKMPVGTNSTGRHRSLFKLLNLKAEVDGKSVASAKLTLYESGTGTSGQLIRANRITKDWTPSTVTWNNQPTWNTEAYTAQVTTSGTKNTAKVFDCTSFVRNISLGTANYGLILRNMNSDPSYACFWGSRYATTSYRPKLVVTYYDRPETFTSASISRYINNEGFVSSNYFKPGNYVYASWKGAKAYKFSEIQYKITGYSSTPDSLKLVSSDKVDLTTYRSIGKAAASATNKNVPYAKYLPEGKYKLFMRTKDAAGNVSSGKYKVIYVDGTAPSLTGVSISAGSSASSYATTLTPKITWTASDTYFSKMTLSVDGGTEKTIATAAGTKSYTLPAGMIKKSGHYKLTLKAHDKSRNRTTKTIDFYVDVDAPVGGIEPKAQATGENTDLLSGTVPINLTIKDEGSGIQSSSCSFKIYKTTKDSSGNYVIDSSSAKTIESNLTESKTAILNTVGYTNGTYKLLLTMTDKVGNTTTAEKDVTIKNVFQKPLNLSVNDTKTTSSTLSWSFPTGTSLKAIKYRFDSSSTWTTVTVTSGTVSGTTNVTVPSAEGSHTVEVKGVSTDDVEGVAGSTQFDVDKTVPSASLSGLDAGYLKGTVTDMNFKNWTVHVKEKSASSYDSTAYAEGTEQYTNGKIAFVNFADSRFKAGTVYTFKITATDTAGNTKTATVDLTAPDASSMTKKTDASFKIVRNSQQERGKDKFIVKSDQKTLSLDKSISNVKWYVNNSLADSSLVKSDGTLKHTKGTYHEIVAVNENSGGERQYSVPLVSNVNQTVNMSDGSVSGNVVTKTVSYTDKVVSFKLNGSVSGATYRVKVTNGSYVQIQPNTKYYVSNLKSGSVYTNGLAFEVTVPAGTAASSAKVYLAYDSIEGEQFMISDVEKCAPTGLAAVDKINYKTYISWNVPSSIPDNVYYEVYRGESKNFEPSAETLAADHIKEGYFTEININYSASFYYKVCAVETDSSGKILNRSSFSNEIGSDVVDQDEYAKFLGMKDYWEFTEFETANGNGYIEKSRGNFVYVQQDAELPNEGLEVYLARTYNSRSSSQGAFGYGWSHDYDMELLNICEADSLEVNNIVFKDGDGTVFLFTRNSEKEEFTSSLGSYIDLSDEKEDKTKQVSISGNGSSAKTTITYRYVMTTKDGLQYYFNSGGQLVFLEEANGNFLVFEHGGDNGLLTKLLTNNNLAITFTYQTESEGDPLLVKKISMPDGSTVSYEYKNPLVGAQDLLTKVTATSGGKSITYQYSYTGLSLSSDQKNLDEIKDATGKYTYKLKYDSSDRVTAAEYPNGEKFTFEYLGEISADETATVTKKYSNGTVVLGEKDYFDESTGRCSISVRGVENPDSLNSSTKATEEANYDVTKYSYVNGLLSSTETKEEYNIIDANGVITTSTDVKTEKVGYDGDDPVEETESDGTVSKYTYYPESAGEGIAGLIKTAKETDAEGNVVSNVHYTYDQNGNVLTEIDYAAETKEVFTYVASGAFKGELATEKEYLFQASGTTVTNEVLQSTTEYSYKYSTGSNQTKTETVKQTIPTQTGGTETVTVTTVYDQMGRELSETDSRGYVTSNTFDGFGRVTSTDYRYDGASSAKKTTTTTYDDNGLVTYEKLEDGIEKTYTYDNMQRVTATKIKKGSIEQTVNTAYSYEDISVYKGKGAGTVSVKKAYKTTTTCGGNTLSITYEDNQGRIVRTYENGLYTDMTYNRQGDMITKWSMGKTLSATDGLLEVYVYDKQGNLTHTITDPDYVSGSGFKIREDSEDGATPGSIVSESIFDDAGNAVASVDPNGNRVDYSYDEVGNLLSATVPYKAVDSGNIDSETAVEGSTTTTSDSVAAENKVTYQYQYDVPGSNNTTMDIVLQPQTNSSGSIVNAKSVVVKDSADRTVKVVDYGTSDSDSSNITTSYTYDDRDNLTKTTDSNGSYKVYSYDKRDRVTSITYHNSSGAKALKTVFDYDDSDNMTSMADYECSGSTETLYRYTDYDYDDVNRLKAVAELTTGSVPTETQIANNQVIYDYDVKDNLTKITYAKEPFGISSLEFTYDSNNWLTKVTANGSKTVREYSYDNYGRVSVITDYTDFLNGTSKWMKRTYSYDRFHRPISIEYKDNMSGSSTAVKEGHYYTYDSGSNIISERTVNSYGSSSNGAAYEQLREYTYNAAGQLTETHLTEKNSSGSVTNEQQYDYTYDITGNRTKEKITTVKEGTDAVEDTAFTYTEFNQVKTAVTKNEAGTTTASKTFTYDANGNQTKEVDSKTSTTKEFVYDGDNRLKTAKETTGSTVEFTQTNKYNGFGQRVQKKETVSGTTDTINYFYDGTSVLYTTNGSSAITAMNLIGAEDNILATMRSSTESYVYTKDMRESTINVVGKSGTAPVSYEYTDYGETEILGDQDFYNEVCYSGGIYDETTGLYYLNARYYSPENAAFLTQDTYRGDRSRTATLNYYSYCAGNPVNYTDPSGHAFWGIVGAAMGAYDGYKYAKKKKLKGVKKAAAIVGGAALGAVNPFKVVKAAKKVYKAAKYAKKARSTYKKAKSVVKAAKKAKVTKVKVKKYNVKKGKPTKKKKYKKTLVKNKKKAKSACFVAGTKVSMENGFTPIEQIKPGDYVWSENPETNEKALKKVNKIFVREKDSIIRLSINGEVIETTDEHPFYVKNKGFVGAGSLEAGDKVRLQSGKTAAVDSVEEIQLEQPIKVYNFEVEDFHTYYVSEQQVLVHNTCAAETTKQTKSKYWKKTKFVAGKKVYQRDDLIDPNRTNDLGETSLELMKRGNAPIGPDGKPVNLHHMTQMDDSALAEVSTSFHQKNSKVLHINPNSIPSGINRSDFNKWKTEYWMTRAKDFE